MGALCATRCTRRIRCCVPPAPCAEVVVLLDGYGQSGYMASIMRPRAGLAGRLGDLAKMALAGRLPQAALFGAAPETHHPR